MAGHDIPTSPLALPLPEMPAVPGVRVASGRAAIRYKDRDDVTVMAFPAGTTVAGVFTRNRCPGAPVDWCRSALPGGKARGLVVTAGNSNVFTGRAGRQSDSRLQAQGNLPGLHWRDWRKTADRKTDRRPAARF